MGACNTNNKKKGQVFYLKTSAVSKLPKDLAAVPLEIKAITPSLLYNLLTKNHNNELMNQLKQYEVLDVRTHSEYSELHLHDSINLELREFYKKKLELPKEFKIVLNLKSLIIVGFDSSSSIPEETHYLIKEFERTGIKLNAIYILPHGLSEFIKTYSFFSHKSHPTIVRYFLPTLIFDRADIQGDHLQIIKRDSSSPGTGTHAPGAVTPQKIFVQLLSKFDSYFPEFLAEELGTHLIYFSADTQNLGAKYQNIGRKSLQGSSPQPDKYTFYYEKSAELNNLKKNQLKKLLKTRQNFIMVNDSASSTRVLEFFQDVLVNQLRIDRESLLRYIQERVPKFNVSNPEEPLLTQGNEPKKNRPSSAHKKETVEKIQKEEIDIMTRCDEFRVGFSSLKKECGSYSATQDLYNLIMRIVENIIKDPENEKFRKLNRANEKLQNTIFKYPSCVKILGIVGFFNKDPQGEIYVNSLDLSSIKLIRGDLELAFRKFSDAEKE